MVLPTEPRAIVSYPLTSCGCHPGSGCHARARYGLERLIFNLNLKSNIMTTLKISAHPAFHKIGFDPKTEQVKFTVTLKGESFEFSAGIGCIPSEKKLTVHGKIKSRGDRKAMFLRHIQSGSVKALANWGDSDVRFVYQSLAAGVEVSEADFFSAVLSDMRGGELSFADFCSEFGYSDDSISALRTHQQCQENGRKLRRVLSSGEIEGLETELQDY